MRALFVLAPLFVFPLAALAQVPPSPASVAAPIGATETTRATSQGTSAADSGALKDSGKADSKAGEKPVAPDQPKADPDKK